MINANLDFVYSKLAKLYPNKYFCRFSCLLLGQCRTENADLAKNILDHLRKKVIRRFNFIEYFEGVDQRNCENVLSRIHGLQSKINGEILSMIKSIHRKFAEFKNLTDGNEMFQICFKKYIENGIDYRTIYESFTQIHLTKNKKHFIKYISKINSKLFEDLLRRWFQKILIQNNLDNAKIYFEILFKQIATNSTYMGTLKANLEEIKSDYPIDRTSSLFNHFELLSKSNEFLPELTRTLKKHRLKILREYQIHFTERAWEDYLKVVPSSKFSKQFLAKMMATFDETVNQAKCHEGTLWKNRISNLEELNERQREVVDEFSKETMRTPEPDEDFDDKSAIQKLVVINKLFLNTICYKIFKKIIEAYLKNNHLKQYFMKSDLIRLLVELGDKVISREVSIEQMLLIKQFYLRIPMRAALAFGVENVYQHTFYKYKSNELMHKENKFFECA